MIRPLDREILRLAVPALGALIAEPLFLLADSAIVAHLSTESLAGLTLASTVLTTVIGLCIFLAYSTTAAVARALGAGRSDEALRRGIDAVWLGLLIGVVAVIVLAPLSRTLISFFGAHGAVLHEGTVYLAISTLGVPAMLAVQATTGVIRGLQDTTTPLKVAATGAVANVGLDYLLVFPVGWGIAGSAIATVSCQWGMAIALMVVVARGAREHGVSLRPRREGIRGAGREGAPLLVRTLCLRFVLILMAWAALRLGTAALASHQIVLQLWNLMAMALDALAIAGQALTGKHLGGGATEMVTAITKRLTRWGVAAGTGLGLVLLAVSVVLPGLFSPDPAVQQGIRWALVVVVVSQPVAGYVFVLDGVLMGAGDAPYLARAGLVTVAVYLPFVLVQANVGPAGIGGLVLLWVTYGAIYMSARAATLWWRVRGGAWMRVGA